MTIAPALMLVVGQVAPTALPMALLSVPADWTGLPLLPWRSVPQMAPELATFVREEARAGRCSTPARAIGGVELAVLVRSDGRIRAVVPRAIDCPTVEQFAAGLVSSAARNKLRQPAAGWYRTAITLDPQR